MAAISLAMPTKLRDSAGRRCGRTSLYLHLYIYGFHFFCCGTGLSQEPLHRCFCSHCKWFWPHFPTVTVRFSQSDPPFWHFYLLSGVKGLVLHDRCTLATQFAMTIPSKVCYSCRNPTLWHEPNMGIPFQIAAMTC